MFDALLSAPFPFVLTQSFGFLTKSPAQALLQRQFNRMANAGDFAVSQAEELKDALDALTSNEFVMGDHHFSLQVMTDERPSGDATATPTARKPAGVDARVLERCTSRWRGRILADSGMTVAREDSRSRRPSGRSCRETSRCGPRKAPITSRNFAGMVPFHNYPAGRAWAITGAMR